ncbi:hypothetical protein B0H13DRAFT_1852437 [Mycena leptocephala]|nr:hypothetical protein B0H13DRAFT_1852437 [Mycena leptocephala]
MVYKRGVRDIDQGGIISGDGGVGLSIALRSHYHRCTLSQARLFRQVDLISQKSTRRRYEVFAYSPHLPSYVGSLKIVEGGPLTDDNDSIPWVADDSALVRILGILNALKSFAAIIFIWFEQENTLIYDHKHEIGGVTIFGFLVNRGPRTIDFGGDLARWCFRA